MRFTMPAGVIFALTLFFQTCPVQALETQAYIDWTDGDGDPGFLYFLTDLDPTDGLDARLGWTRQTSQIEKYLEHRALIPLLWAEDWGTTPLVLSLNDPVVSLIADGDALRIAAAGARPTYPFGYLVSRSGEFILGPRTRVTFEVPAAVTSNVVGNSAEVGILMVTSLYGFGFAVGDDYFDSYTSASGETGGSLLRIEISNPSASEKSANFVAQISISGTALPVPEPHASVLMFVGLGFLVFAKKKNPLGWV